MLLFFVSHPKNKFAIYYLFLQFLASKILDFIQIGYNSFKVILGFKLFSLASLFL